jgi:hypothetical protein
MKYALVMRKKVFEVMEGGEVENNFYLLEN